MKRREEVGPGAAGILVQGDVRDSSSKVVLQVEAETVNCGGVGDFQQSVGWVILHVLENGQS